MTRTPDVGLPTASRFSSPDDQPGLEDLIAYLDNVERLGAFRELHTIADDWLAIEAGHSVLDLGCGLGRATRAAAHRAGSTGKAVGLDISQALLRIAEARSIDDPAPVYVHGDGSALPFPGAAFDRIRAERLLMHVAKPATVLSEIVRVLRPSGKVVLVEPDWGSLQIIHANQSVRDVLRAGFNSAIKNPDIGADLSTLCSAAKLTVVADKAHVWRSSVISEIDTILRFDRLAEIAVREGFHRGPTEALIRDIHQGPMQATLPLTVLAATKSADLSSNCFPT